MKRQFLGAAFSVLENEEKNIFFLDVTWFDQIV